MEYRFINSNEEYYTQAIQLRIELFFSDFVNATEMINDQYENSGIHLVCVENDDVIGTGRLNIVNNIGIISQMAIDCNHQKKGIGQLILSQLINHCKAQKITSVQLSARLTALNFYKKHHFIPIGNVYPSKKTGVIHQEMTLELIDNL